MCTAIRTEPDETALVNTLKMMGINILRMPSLPDQEQPLEPPVLIAALAGHTEPRLRESLIPLFLRQSQLHHYVPALTASLDPGTADVLRHFYTAAVYLQQMWFSTLQLYLGTFPLLLNYFGQAYYHLPSPEDHFGEAGLRALANNYTNQTGYDWLSTYQSAISLLMTQLNLEQMKHG